MHNCKLHFSQESIFIKNQILKTLFLMYNGGEYK